ncbi:hypothetical protein AB0F81_17745 [Actinoplanes sp. NPDC024001]|uniref:hypothetical protein n=1 Tax=Actinoplanes sp. NPDC024001 TaxID=3154598 RepID=UPI0033EBB03B
MSTSDQIRIRLFAEAPAARSEELATALAHRLAGHGHVQVHEIGTYGKDPRYLEFDLDLTPAGSASDGIGRLRALQPAGWSGDVWNHQPDRPAFLLPEVRWAWLTTGGLPARPGRRTRRSTVAAIAATALLAVISFSGTSLVGLALAMSCDGPERDPAVCAEDGFWFASRGFLYPAIGGLGVAVLAAWVWPRRDRWAWIGAGYLIVLAGFAVSVTLLRNAP